MSAIAATLPHSSRPHNPASLPFMRTQRFSSESRGYCTEAYRVLQQRTAQRSFHSLQCEILKDPLQFLSEQISIQLGELYDRFAASELLWDAVSIWSADESQAGDEGSSENEGH